MRTILIERLDKIYNDIIKYYIHSENLQDEDIDDDIRDILDRIDELQNKIDYIL